MKLAYVLFADGFEDIEALTPVDILKRAGINVILLSISNQRIVTSAHGTQVETDGLLKDYLDQEADIIITPGGAEGAKNLRDNDTVIKLLQRQAQQEKYIASICASPIVLDKATLLKDKHYTCYPGFEAQIELGIHTPERLVVDNKIITAMGPGVSFEFALKLVELLVDKTKADEIKKGMLII